MTTIKIGDIFDSSAQTLVNTVNCVGVMGKGIAKEFKKRYPTMFEDYAARCAVGAVQLGKPYHYTDLFGGISIVNFPTKKHWRSPSRLSDIAAGLDYFVAHYQSWGLQSVAFPPLGCGNGGLEWRAVGPLMYQKLSGLSIPVEIFAPYGTVNRELSHAFLAQPFENLAGMVGAPPSRLKDEWLALLEVVYQLSRQSYTRPVGRIIFQKICYIMTELGLETGFTFRQGSYGPFSDDVQNALTALANANLVREEQLGRMTALLASPEYERQRAQFAARLAPYQKWIHKTVDLFSRIKNTDQAEEVTSVLYAARKLKSERGEAAVSEQDVLEYINAWKKKTRDPEKQETIAAAIRNLQMLGWLKLAYSESLPFSSF
ncbi:MAG: macro domain-containing protein [Anaerolineales bacterium]|nr:macro domain-containing protein [Anaerolineales bacterium]